MTRQPNLVRLLADPPDRPDRRSIGRSNAVAAHVLRHPGAVGQLIRALWNSDYVIRMRAADALEKASLQNPKLLARYKSELLGLLAEANQQELRWHLALMLPRLPLTPAERLRAAAHLCRYLDDSSSIVKTCALQALAEFAEQDGALRPGVLDTLRAAARSGTAAMRARSRILLKRLKAEP
jgi:HEAT repeat protein